MRPTPPIVGAADTLGGGTSAPLGPGTPGGADVDASAPSAADPNRRRRGRTRRKPRRYVVTVRNPDGSLHGGGVTEPMTASAAAVRRFVAADHWPAPVVVTVKPAPVDELAPRRAAKAAGVRLVGVDPAALDAGRIL